MPWETRDVMDQRIEFVVRASRAGSNVSRLCKEFGISRDTGYRWLRRYRACESISELGELSRAPHRVANRTDRRIERRVLSQRLKTGWGAKKIHVLLAQKGLKVSVRTINNILKRHQVTQVPSKLRSATKRFERQRPNELWQMDFKGEFRNPAPACFPLTVLDDHSRFSLGLFPLKATGLSAVQGSLLGAFERHGVPEAMLMDHGSPWWSTHSEHGLTGLSVWLMKQGIKLYYSGIGHPQTQGKIERFHRTLKAEVTHRGTPASWRGWKSLFAKIQHDYNYVRPHEALQMDVPAQHYEPSKKSYNSSPTPWEYPKGSLVLKVNSAGNINYKQRQLFISHALAGEGVRVQASGERLIVSYRHMYIREIDLKKGLTRPLVLPISEAKV